MNDGPLDALRRAIQDFASGRAAVDGDTVLVTVGVVVWEETSVDSDGEVQYRIKYAVPTDSFSPAAVLGLINAGELLIGDDLVSD